MKTSELDYYLPKELIAQKPTSPRDAAKLMFFSKKTGKIAEGTFSDLPVFLKKGDVLVFNKTKVFPARVFAKNKNGRKIEILFLTQVSPFCWEVLVGGKIEPNEKLFLTPKIFGVVTRQEGTFLKINIRKTELMELLEKIGETPLPPYIKRKINNSDKENYQTVFAQKLGSAAAPTAGLHFTPELIRKLKKAGIRIEYITLHVGLGTFAPIKTEKVEAHPIHSETVEISAKTVGAVNEAKRKNQRIIACGTTAMRALESVSQNGKATIFKGQTSLFIYPGYKFQMVDGLITNFHTPRSSLLALVYAFAGKQNVRRMYQLAVKKKYRFFSYGDGMLIL